MHFRIQPDVLGHYRWQLRAANNRIIAVSGEGYLNKADCLYAIRLVKSAYIAPVAG
jgi:uncharacterized protein YegP (UPF0339 family)